MFIFFFFQAEDGIRDSSVTGVQTCALPICSHVGAKGLGLLMSAAGVGAVLGALQFAARTEYKGLAKWIGATSTTCAIGLMVFSQARAFWLCAVVLFAVGFAATSQMAATNTIIQERVPEAMRSR